MIERYTRDEMGRLFSDEARLGAWLEVELAASAALAHRGEIPQDAYEALVRGAVIDVARAAEIESEVHHDVIAFVTSVAEKIGPEGRYLHLGLTSSDVVDTALALQMVRACDLLLAGFDALLATLKQQAKKWRDQPMIGRTHGIHAEPVTFGLKVASWYAETERNRGRIERARAVIRFGKLSGAVGTCAHLSPEIEQDVMERLDLQVEPVATQVVPRDRHAEMLTALALAAAGLERMATEIRHLQRTEVREVEEPFRKGQKGSSAMPHKRNPIACENVSGLARVVRSNALAAMQDIALWHERDISHSSVERVIVPDSFVLLDFMLARMTRVARDLHVYPDAMQKNLDGSRGFPFSQALLLALVRSGMSREEAYALVQGCAMSVWDGRHPSLQDACGREPGIKGALGAEGLEQAFDAKTLLRHVPGIVKRALAGSGRGVAGE